MSATSYQGIVLILISAFMSAAEAGGTVELGLVRYYNRHGHDSTWDHCDSFFRLFKTSKCDPYFKIKMKNGDHGTEWGMITTQVYSETNIVDFGAKVNKVVSNPIVRHFDKWMGPLELDIEVMDHDTFTAHDLVDNIHYSADFSPDGILRRKLIRGTAHGLDSHFSFTVKVQCDPHYYGPSCTKRCVPRDDKGGHYTCTKDGDRKCLPTWHGLETGCLRRDMCRPNPCLHGGNCTAVANTAFRCSCKTDYHGLTCAVRTKPCEAHDHCHNGGKCINVGLNDTKCACLRGWSGHFCDFDRNECTDGVNPCENGGVCVNQRGGFTCKCPKGFTGETCEEDINECEEEEEDFPLCLHNSTCVNTNGSFECACHSGYNGTHCEFPFHFIGESMSLMHQHLRRSRIALVVTMTLILVVIVINLILLWRRREFFHRLRLMAKTGRTETGASVHMSSSEEEPRLEFKNAVYEALDERGTEKEFVSCSDEEKRGMTNEAYICENKDEYHKTPITSPKSTPAREQPYVYSSLAEKETASHASDPRSLAVKVLIDSEDGYMQMPSDHDSSKPEEDEEKLRQLFDDPSNFPPEQPTSPSRDRSGQVSSEMEQAQEDGCSVA